MLFAFLVTIALAFCFNCILVVFLVGFFSAVVSRRFALSEGSDIDARIIGSRRVPSRNSFIPTDDHLPVTGYGSGFSSSYHSRSITAASGRFTHHRSVCFRHISRSVVNLGNDSIPPGHHRRVGAVTRTYEVRRSPSRRVFGRRPSWQSAVLVIGRSSSTHRTSGGEVRSRIRSVRWKRGKNRVSPGRHCH